MIDFPASPTENQMFQAPGGPRYVYSNGGWRMSDPGPPGTAQTRNRIVNGAMQITQEYARGTNLTATGGYFADQWQSSFLGDGTVAYANVPNSYIGADAGPYCATLAVSTVDASLTTSQNWTTFQNIEGVRISDFNWGTAN